MSSGRRVLGGAAIAVVAVAALLVVGVVLALGAGAQESSDVEVRSLTVVRADADTQPVPQLIDELAPTTVLSVRAEGFRANTTGRIVQCVDAGRRACRNSIPIRFDDRGTALIQYLVTDAVGGEGRCRLAGDRCSVEVQSGDHKAVVDTVFVDTAPPLGTLSIESADELTLGADATVIATGFPADATLTVRVCAWPATRGNRCGAPGPEVQMTTDATGTAQATITFDVEKVGADEVACGRRTRCQLVVDSSEVGVRARPLTLAFTTTPGATYDPSRVLIGLLVAAALAVVALRFTMTTDWRPPAEANASLIDDAEYADLDAEAEQFEDVFT